MDYQTIAVAAFILCASRYLLTSTRHSARQMRERHGSVRFVVSCLRGATTTTSDTATGRLVVLGERSERDGSGTREDGVRHLASNKSSRQVCENRTSRSSFAARRE
eukprot:4688653-Prymnesium_polylepis.1